ncbi:MAG TPA: nucleoside hydrolase [Gemmataceae bacterium]|nr:nucleoside hydrolase [Gemmataceae bacterium]
MRAVRLFITACLLGSLWLAAPPLAAQEPSARMPVLLDTDLGSDIGDAFALALILASPELDLRGVTTVSGETQTRALMACRFLTMTGRRHTAVAAGAAPQPPQEIVRTGQYRYYYHPDILFNRTTRPVKESAVEFLYSRLKAQPGKVTLIAAGPLTNIAHLVTEKPECKPWIRRIILTESNLRADVKAAQAVFASGAPLVVVPLDATARLKLDEDDLRRVFAPGTALTLQVQAIYQLWDGQFPVLADALAVGLCLDERFCKMEDLHLDVDAEGLTRLGKGKPNARVATSVDREAFLKWYVERLENCVSPARRLAEVVRQGAFPHRVHVAEDFDTDIERFWWMSGKAETKNLPPGSRRACRGVLTHDFDDLLGNPKAMYTAVIFNPVPGPPMGKNTRLSFRYWLKGSQTLRVQIYSLTNGYHRHLVLTGLPQGRWESATVDMTVARRPDGTGGPLSENERIDDIQFYTEPTAELLIDDIVLFDAASPGEKRPFPKHVHFAAGFDTGTQGKHWLGNFEIVPDKGYFWRAARSVPSPEGKLPWIRLQLRGERPLSRTTEVFFRYHLTGASSMQVLLVKGGWMRSMELKGLQQGKWAEATARFDLPDESYRAAEIHFLLPKGAELLLDDLLLYEPGR